MTIMEDALHRACQQAGLKAKRISNSDLVNLLDEAKREKLSPAEIRERLAKLGNAE